VPAGDPVYRLALDKRLGYQRLLLVIAPAPPFLAKNYLHLAVSFAASLTTHR